MRIIVCMCVCVCCVKEYNVSVAVMDSFVVVVAVVKKTNECVIMMNEKKCSTVNENAFRGKDCKRNQRRPSSEPRSTATGSGARATCGCST